MSMPLTQQVSNDDVPGAWPVPNAMDLLNTYAHVFFIAFLIALLATPVMRTIALRNGIIDRPDSARKLHREPVAYLGGLAVLLGLLFGIAASYVTTDSAPVTHLGVPIAIVIGMLAIAITGMMDDVWGWDPRLKIAGQLVAAAAMAIESVGVNVANGILAPILGDPEQTLLQVAGFTILNGHLYYWVGTALIAAFVLGGSNAANLIDGLDGLLSGVVAIVGIGLLIICILMATHPTVPGADATTDTLAGARIVLCLALIGAVLGFLPYNFNPANIFLGDCGSLLLGYSCCAVILMLGEFGQTHLVAAGLLVFALPIMDTLLAIIRRLLAGIPLSTADKHHIHHQFKRGLGSVKVAVLALYAVTLLFAALGVVLAALVIMTELRVRVVYAVAFVIFSFIGVIAVKAARRQQFHEQSVSVPHPTPATSVSGSAASRQVLATPDPKPDEATDDPETSAIHT